MSKTTEYNDFLEQRVSFFQNSLSTQKTTDISIADFIELIKSDDYKKIVSVELQRAAKYAIEQQILEEKGISVNVPMYAQLEPTINELRQVADKKERAKIKQRKLPAITTSGIFGPGHNEGELQRPSGLMQIDFDDLPENMHSILCHDPYTFIGFKSPSGTGLKMVVKIPADASTHKQSFAALQDYYLEKYGQNIDPDCKDICRLLFFSYDPNIYVNENSFVFTHVKEQEDDLPPSYPSKKQASNFIEVDVRKITDQVIASQIDMTGSYKSWLELGFALADGLGEGGREYFHGISQFHATYDYKKCDSQYNECLKNRKPGTITIATFFDTAKNHGIFAKEKVVPSNADTQEAAPNEYPIEILPKKLQDIINGCAHYNKFPKGFLAASLFVVAATAIGNSIHIRSPQGWTTSPIFFGAIIGPPGTMKSPPMKFALRPLSNQDKNAYKSYKQERDAYDSSKSENKGPEPKYMQTTVDDITPEALAVVLDSNPRGVLFAPDELSSFINGIGQYKKKSNESSSYLKLYDGTDIIINRRSFGVLRIDSPYVSILGGIQPGVLSDFLANNGDKNGFTERFIYVIPDGLRMEYLNENERPKEIEQSWEAIIQRILGIPFRVDPEYGIQSNMMEMTVQAKIIYRDWYNKHVDIANSTENDKVKGLISKLHTQCLRMILVCQCLLLVCDEDVNMTIVTARAAEMGCALADFHYKESLRAHAFMDGSTSSVIIESLNVLQRRVYDALSDSFKKGEGVKIGMEHGMSEKTAQRFIEHRKDLFKKVKHGLYEKL